jgi:hypothetical protein
LSGERVREIVERVLDHGTWAGNMHGATGQRSASSLFNLFKFTAMMGRSNSTATPNSQRGRFFKIKAAELAGWWTTLLA